MTIAIVALAALAAVEPIKIAVPDFQGSVAPEQRQFFVEYFSERLIALGNVQVTTPSQIAAVLGVERQKELLGCSQQVTCTAELAGALGAEVLILGSIAKVGSDFALTVKAIDAKTSQPVAALSGRGAKEEALLDFLATAARQVHAEVLGKFRGISLPRSGRHFGAHVWVPGAVGVASGIASAVLFALANGAASRLTSGDPTLPNRAAARELAMSGSGQQLASGVMLGVGVAALATATLLYFLVPQRDEVPSLALVFP